MKKILLIIMCLVATFSSYAQTDAPNYVNRVSPVTVNGVCGVPDKYNNQMFFSLHPKTPAQFTAAINAPDGYTLKLNGKPVTGKVTISDWQKNNLSHTLTITDNTGNVETWTMVFTTLPIVCIDVDEKQLQALRKKDNYAKLGAYLHLIDPEKRTNGTPLYHHYIAMRIRGATSAGGAKKPYSIELRDHETQEECDTCILGMRKDGDWVLDAAFNDHSKMRNRVIMDIWRQIDKLPYPTDNKYQFNSTEGHFVEVIQNGRYHGIYCLSDKIDRKKLNLKKTSVSADGKETARGLLWKARIKPAAGKGSAGTLGSYKEETRTDSLYWEGLTQEFPEDTSMLRWDVVKQIVDVANYNTNKSRYDENTYYKVFAEQAPSWFYIDNLVHYCILLNAFYLRDNIGKNFYISIRNINNGNQVLFTPWDTDVSFGRNVGGKSTAEEEKQYAFGSDMSTQSPIARLISYYSKYSKVDELRFRNRLYHEWQLLSRTTLSIESVMGRIEQYATLLTNSGAYQREYDKWCAILEAEDDYKKLDEDLFTEVEFMRTWYTKNFGIMDKYINDLYDESAEIYLDGRDKYRIVSTALNSGSIAIGSEHNSSEECIYIADDHQLTDDCWWYIDYNKNEQWRLRNAKTNQCMLSSSKIKLIPDIDHSPNIWWSFDKTAGYYRFQTDNSYLKLNTSTLAMETSKYASNTQFYLVDEAGNALYPDDIINRISAPSVFEPREYRNGNNSTVPYTLWGQPATTTTQGIIIQNGKKLRVKR